MINVCVVINAMCFIILYFFYLNNSPGPSIDLLALLEIAINTQWVDSLEWGSAIVQKTSQAFIITNYFNI